MNQPPVLHILVIGFHHKKGCQVEFSYPSIVSEKEEKRDTIELPPVWKDLPSLAMPDGSHNFEDDSVFFNLPSLDNPNQTVYGISCYRQIPVEQLVIRTADVTRSTVQKSVCILASVPVYGYIEVKLSLIAHAYFDQGDFACTEILTKAYEQLNNCLIDGEVSPLQHINVGLSLRDIILRWRYKTLIMFKLMLLQKRVICFGSPVRPICSLILGIASLHPLLLENGFEQVACVKTERPISAINVPIKEDTINICQKHIQTSLSIDSREDTTCAAVETTNNSKNRDQSKSNSFAEQSKDITKDNNTTSEQPQRNNSEKDLANEYNSEKKLDKHSLGRDSSIDMLANGLQPLCSFNPSIWNAPFPVYTGGNLCLPYLSLPYMDRLSDPSVIGYTIGTSNILFQQKKHLADVLIDVERTSIVTEDADIKKQLTLTTEDLRFVEFINRHVQMPKEDAEGSEQWIREQFKGYMLAMLKTSLQPEGFKEVEHFNSLFITTWRKTACYQQWLASCKPDDSVILSNSIPIGHPFSGTLSVADMKLKITQTMNNSESGRKLNQAVNTTSKAVGGALMQAKGAFSNWWSTMTAQPAQMPPEIDHTAIQATFDSGDESVLQIIDNGCDAVVHNDTYNNIKNNKQNDQNCHTVYDNELVVNHNVETIDSSQATTIINTNTSV